MTNKPTCEKIHNKNVRECRQVVKSFLERNKEYPSAYHEWTCPICGKYFKNQINRKGMK